MSTGLECEIVSVRGLGTFYLLQNPSCPASCWDWRDEDPLSGGPFPSAEAASLAVSHRHGNPGGHSEMETTIAGAISDPQLKEAIEKCIKKPLVDPGPPPGGEDITWSVNLFGTWGSIDKNFHVSLDDDGHADIRMKDGWREDAKDLGSAQLSVRRDDAGITVSLDGTWSKEARDVFEDMLCARLKKHYPDDLIVMDTHSPKTEEPSP